MKPDKNTKTHPGRTDLLGEHKLGDSLQLIALFAFMIIWVLDSFIFRVTTVWSHEVPIYIRMVISLLFLVISFYLSRKGLKVIFGQVRDKPEIITKGVFGRVRHPIYLCAILLYPVFFIMTFSLASFVFWLAIIFMYNWIAGYEEKIMTKHFGTEYLDYTKKAGK